MARRRDYVVPAGRNGSILDDAELNALRALVDSGEVLSQGSRRAEFEERLRDHVGTRHALTVTSGTVALDLAVHLLDLRPGDEVVTTPQSFKAMVDPLLAHPVDVRFCDVREDTLNLDPRRLEELITARTRALVLVHFGGHPAEMDEILRIARRHGLLVIEDCAHALGALYHGRRPGSLADIGCFSFHTSKNITSLGEGGLLTFDRDDWADRLDRLRSNATDGVYRAAPDRFGQPDAVRPWMMWVDESYEQICSDVRRPGGNATMSEAGAAVGTVQLGRMARLVGRRRWIADRITATLRGFPQVRVAEAPPGVEHAYHLYTFFVRPGHGIGRDEVVAALDRAGVEVQLRYFPLHLRPEWRGRGHGPGECPVAERVWFHEQINLPCHPSLTDEQVEHMLRALKSAFS
ncbi:DegT/DnrJ/EryC1/StrS aminotransferase family protein [Streptomyces cacaoi]|uniref:DegT/DnrJ/EryC1/StrS aminotransferase family protein n=1 Tax=Streptomyces cacaoi TaxID=1898 RepID=UPI00260E0807|nr:DegT/DnrJ/EryC1/StrS family aminotransferase [Streptomyces cacaoi]